MNNIVERFLEIVSKRGESVAIETVDRKITFGELNQLSDKMMEHIMSATGTKRTRVILYLSHTYNIIVAILAILKSGNVYIPVSLEATEERKKYIAECCQADLAITDQEYPYVQKVIHVVDVENDELEEKKRDYVTYKGSDEVYILFTSGSTGEPKGCAITYNNLLYILNNIQKFCPTDVNSAYCFSTPYTFDVSTTEIYGWIGGGKVVVYDTTQYTSYRDFCKIVDKHRITHLAISPSGLANMLKTYKECDLEILANRLQFVMVAGEEFKKTIYDKWNKENWKFRLFNLYGPTEATVYALHYELQHNSNYEDGIPLGEPFEECDYVIDNPDSEGIGELVLLGEGICAGYINNEAEMKKRFNLVSSKRSYNTGDMVSVKNGILYYRGRNDDQIQINGIRVELGEIEAAMMKLNEIDDVCVASYSKMLISYVCLKKEIELDTVELRKRLSMLMPRYMIPNYIKIVSQIPLNENRKSDRKKIIREYIAIKDAEVKEKVSYIEKDASMILCYMKEILEEKMDNIDLREEDDFFEKGADSLDAFTLAAYLEEKFGLKLDVDMIYLNRSARGIGQYIASVKGQNQKEEKLADEENLLKMAELNWDVHNYLYDTTSKMIRSYRALYLQQVYYFNKIKGSIVLDYNVGMGYSKEKVHEALLQLMQQNIILRSKLKKEDGCLYFEEYEVNEETRIPIVKLSSNNSKPYLKFLLDNYTAQIYEARFHEGYLALFIIAEIDGICHVIGFLDHCIGDAGCVAIIKRKIGKLLSGERAIQSISYYEYVKQLNKKNTLKRVEKHPYIKKLCQYVVPNREEFLDGLENDICKIELEHVPQMDSYDYTVLVSYLAAKIISNCLGRNIATSVTLNNRDYLQYQLKESIGDVHTSMSFMYNRGMKFDEYARQAQKVWNMFGKGFFQPFQAIENNYPSCTREQRGYMDMVVRTRVLKVDFLGQISEEKLKIKEGSMQLLYKDLHRMINSIYATAYAQKDTLVIYFSKDVLQGREKNSYDYAEIVEGIEK